MQPALTIVSYLKVVMVYKENSVKRIYGVFSFKNVNARNNAFCEESISW